MACSVCWRLRAGLSSATGGSRRTRRERVGSSVRHCFMVRRSTYRSASSETRSCAAAQPLSTASPCDGGKGRHSSRVTLDCQSHCTGLLCGATEPPAGVGVTGCFIAAGGCAAGGTAAAAASSDGRGGVASVAGAEGAASLPRAGGAAPVARARGRTPSVAGAGGGAASAAGAGGAASVAGVASGSRVSTASTDECCFRSRQICAEWPTVAPCPFLSQRHGAEAPRRTPVGLAPWLATTTPRSVTVTVA